jgi:hypothetical protein
MGIEVTEGIAKHLDKMWQHNNMKSVRHKSLAYKRKRHESKRTKMDNKIKIAEKKRRNVGWYKPGEGFNECLPILDPNAKKLCRAGCGGTDHLTSQSKKCLFNLENKRLKAKTSMEQQSKEIEAELLAKK